MTTIPDPIHTLESKIYDVYVKRERARGDTRYHMGASQIGDPDARALWLKFRWVFEVQFSGRMLKLFQRGHREEQYIVQDLQSLGARVTNAGDQQAWVHFDGHVGGHMDGIVSNVPGHKDRIAVLECKTSGDSAFKQLVKDKVRKAKPQHYVQMQIYMHGKNLQWALYYVVNKNTDEVYTEWVPFDEETATEAIKRGEWIATSDRLPPPISIDPTDWRMKMSDMYAAYFPDVAREEHWDKLRVWRKSTSPLLARVRCCWRNDALTEAMPDGTWYSHRYNKTIPNERLGDYHEAHVIHPAVAELLGWEWLDGPDEYTARYKIPGVGEVLNGQPREGVFSSEEILTNPAACASLDSYANELRTEFGGRIVA